MNNDTQPLTPEQTPEEAPYPLWPEPLASQAAAWRAYQKAKEAWEASLRKRSEEDAKLLATMRPDFDYPDEKQAYLQRAREAWEAAEAEVESLQTEQPPIHIHGPFTWTMNQNHNALRGCVTCGQSWVGLMAGEVKNLRWHVVKEEEEEEEE